MGFNFLSIIVRDTCRYPFLLVDRVVEWEKEKYAVGYKCVTINDNFFPGHFPERPIMPGKLPGSSQAKGSNA